MPRNAESLGTSPSGMPSQSGESGAVGRSMQWLVSVRDVAEAEQVASFPVDILDLKEPSAGALSPASAETWREIDAWASKRSSVGGTGQGSRGVPLSAALGELEQAIRVSGKLPGAFRFAKAGPGQCDTASGLRCSWDRIRDQIPAATELVAVAYADHQVAESLSAEAVLENAIEAGFHRILIDTFGKTGGSAIQQMGVERLSAFGRKAKAHEIWWSLAGSICLSDLDSFSELFHCGASGPDCIAVRGDLCDGDRDGSIVSERLERWAGRMNPALPIPQMCNQSR